MFTQGPATLAEYQDGVNREYGELADEFLTTYPAANVEEARDSRVAIFTDATFGWEMRTWARMMETASAGRVHQPDSATWARKTDPEQTYMLQPGTSLGPYAVTAKIGEGSMGEVWQARDTKLDRDVALKVLPEAFTADPDRLARFEREAKVLASPSDPALLAKPPAV